MLTHAQKMFIELLPAVPKKNQNHPQLIVCIWLKLLLKIREYTILSRARTRLYLLMNQSRDLSHMPLPAHSDFIFRVFELVFVLQIMSMYGV